MIKLKNFYSRFLGRFKETKNRFQLSLKGRNRKKLLFLIGILIGGIFLVNLEVLVFRPRREEKPAYQPADLAEISPTPVPKGIGRFSVNAPPHTVKEDAIMNMRPVPATVAIPDFSLQGIDAVLFSVKSASGNFITSFLKPITIVATYTDEDLKKCNFDEDSLGIYISEFNANSDSEFKKLPANLDKDKNVLEAQTGEFPSDLVYFTLAAPLPSELADLLNCHDKEELEISEGRVIFKSEGYSLWFPEGWRVGLVGAYGINLGFKMDKPIDDTDWVYLFRYNNFKRLKINELEKLTYEDVSGEIPIIEKDEAIKEKNELIFGERKALFLKTLRGDNNIFRYFLADPINRARQEGWEIVQVFKVEIPKSEAEITRTNSQILPVVEEMIKSMEFFKVENP